MTDAADTGAVAETVSQPTLPFEPLPFDDESDDPIDLTLTARALRAVAPDQLPRLRVVPDASVDLDDPRDTRPARARALRRAGLGTAAIAAQLDVDELLIEGWTRDVRVRGARGRRTRTRTASTPARRAGEQPPAREPADEQWTGERTRGREEAAVRLTADAGFAFAVGLLAGCATLDRHALTIRTADERVAARLLGWLRTGLHVDERRVRAVVRVGPGVSGDLSRRRWVGVLDVDPDCVALARWSSAPTPDAVEVLIRIGEPTVTGRVAGWLDALGVDAPRPDVDAAT